MERNYKEKLSGIFPPCMTIFDENENVAYKHIAENIERYNQTALKGSRDPNCRIPHVVLNSDGTAEFCEFTGAFNNDVHNGQGSWRLERGRDHWTIEVQSTKADWTLDLCNSRPPYVLLEWVNPDSGLARTFVRH